MFDAPRRAVVLGVERAMTHFDETLLVAAPFDRPMQAVDALLQQLDARGLGAWALHDPGIGIDDEQRGPTVPVLLPDGSLLTLARVNRPEPDVLSLSDLEAVRDVG